MTITQAKSLLTTRPLKFGNPAQVAAVQLLSRYEELVGVAKEHDLDCSECEGETTVECPECEGSGKVACDDCTGSGCLTVPADADEDVLDTLEHEVDIQLGRTGNPKQLSLLAA
jgi:RecJ-like exonuclease